MHAPRNHLKKIRISNRCFPFGAISFFALSQEFGHVGMAIAKDVRGNSMILNGNLGASTSTIELPAGNAAP